MNKKVMRKFAAILTISAFLIINLNAQERNDVITAYNNGAKAMQTDLPAAIEAFETAVTLADKVGETAADLKENAIKVLPGLYFKIAYNAQNEKKPAPEIIQAAKKAAAASEKYGNATNKENSYKVLIQAYATMSSDFFKQNDFENALLTYDSILLINPGYLTAIYNKSLIYMRQNNSDAFEETIDKFIAMLKAANDEAKVNQASSMALDYFRASGSKAIQADNLDEALILLNKAEKYGEDKNLSYYLADVYNKQKNYDKGGEYAQRGLDLETGNDEAKAKYYFQLGQAQAGKGQTSDACTSFKNALYGPFAEASKIQRANLKCE